MTTFDPYWLPEGQHYDLHIERHQLSNAGAFTGGGWKIVWHTTESKKGSYSAIKQLFIDRDVAGEGDHPHFCIGWKANAKLPYVCQFVPMNRASKALQHPSGTAETNRANCFQIEICGEAAESGDWGDDIYKALANLALLISHRKPIAHVVPRSFSASKRFTAGGFVTTRGHTGHRLVPSNDHTDPGSGFKGSHLLTLIAHAPHEL